MTKYFLSLGSNQGDRHQHLATALSELAQFSRIVETSPCFETPPLLPPQAPLDWYHFYLNAVVAIETTLEASELLKQTQKIERLCGRQDNHQKWSPRTLDIDILFDEDLSPFKLDNLTLPHPEWQKRSFVVAPLLHLHLPKKIRSIALEFKKTNTFSSPALMAAVNVTPDSFSNTKKDIDHPSLIEHIHNLLKRRVAFIDIGAESTRPGAAQISSQKEWERLQPLLEFCKTTLPQYPFTKLSLDTYHPETAQRALDYKVSILNDVSHLSSPAMREIAPHFESVILMHSLTVPADKNVVLENDKDVALLIKKWFFQKLESLGLSEDRVIFDPGLGFGKTALQSLSILQQMDTFNDLTCRRLVGHSRKSFMENWSDLPASERDIETLGVSLSLAQNNIEILRVHNIEWHQRAFKAASATRPLQ